MFHRLVPLLFFVLITLGRQVFADAPAETSHTDMFKGVFESANMTEIALHLEGWLPKNGGAPIPVLYAVAPGSRVKKGEPLITLDTGEIDRALRDQAFELRGAELNLEQAEKEVPFLERSVAQEIQAAERAQKVAAEELKKFLEEDKPIAEEKARQELEEARYRADFAREDLRQLEKMYRANDLTEHNETMVLHRMRHQGKMAEDSLKWGKLAYDRKLQMELPRKEVDLKEAAAKAALALDKARATLPLTLAHKLQAVAKARSERDKLADKRKRWQQDRLTLTTVTAPVDGIVCYGRCVRGQWSTATEMGKMLQRGGSLGSEEVFMTIVDPRAPLFVRTVVEEKDLALVEVGAAAKVTALVLPNQPLSAKVEQVSAMPLPGGQYGVRMAVELSEHAQKVLLPGMTCMVKPTISTQR